MNIATLLYDPPFAPMLIIGLGVLLAVFAVVAYVRTTDVERRRLSLALLLLRCAAIALAVWILMRPQKELPSQEEMHPRPFAVVLDSSASMNTPDTDEGTRWEKARALLDPRQSRLVMQIEQTNPVFFYQVGEGPKRDVPHRLFDSEYRPEGADTDLGGGLMAVHSEFQGNPPAGILLVSDGRDHGGNIGSAIDLYRADTVPIWTACVGEASEQRDVMVSARLEQHYLYTEQPGKIAVRIDQSGYDGQYATVTARRDGEKLGRRQVQFKQGALRFTIPVNEKETGVIRYQIEVDPLDGESDTANNTRTVFVRVINEKSKILLVEAQPNWDSKFLLRALQGDPNIHVTSIFYLDQNRSYGIRERATDDTLDKEQQLEVVSLPTRPEQLFAYDCLILGKEVDRLFERNAPGLLDEYVRTHGGSVVFYRGRPYEDFPGALPALEPVRWEQGRVEDVQLSLTAEGKLSPIFDFRLPLPTESVVRSLPNLVSVSRTADRKTLATVLAVGKDGATEQAAMAHHRVGAGKVMTIAASGLWRWSFLPNEREDVETVYQTLWSQIVRWAVQGSEFLPGQEVSFRINRRSFSPGESVQFAIRARNLEDQSRRFQPKVVLKNPDKTEVFLDARPVDEQANTWTISQPLEGLGEYEATLWLNEGEKHPETVQFTTYSDSRELMMVSSDPQTLERIADETGGSLLTPDTLGELPGQLKEFALATKETTTRVDIWDTRLLFFLLVALLGLEWFFRRRSGFA